MNIRLRQRLLPFSLRLSRSGRPRVQAGRRPWGRPTLLLLAQILAACDGGSGNPIPDDPPLPPPPVSADIQHGHYRGLSTIGGRSFHAEALLTVDGEFRLFVGASADADGAPATGAGLSGHLLSPVESMQFFGHVTVNGSVGSGAGLVVVEVCALDGGRACGESTTAEASLNGLNDGNVTRLTGEIKNATSSGEETWQLDLSAWSLYYDSPAEPELIGSLFREELARFAEGDDVLLSLDGAGRLFFQGPATGCTGNGALTPHLDGNFLVFDVDLVIENCNANYAFLNTRFTGLATQTQNGYWSYDSWLVIFATTPEGAASRVALTMYASAMDEEGWGY